MTQKIKKSIFITSLIIVICAIVAVGVFVFLNKNTNEDGDINLKDEPFACFVDVLEGDLFISRTQSKKVFMVGVGNGSEYSNRNIKAIIDKYQIESVDYLVYYGLDNKNYLGLSYLFSIINIKKVYLPDITNTTSFSAFNQAKTLFNSNNVVMAKYKYLESIDDGDIKALFLSPYPKDFIDSPFSAFDAVEYPSNEQIANITPIIYYEFSGVRFLISTMPYITIEDKVVNLAKLSLYKIKDYTVLLDNIDFYKIAGMGTSQSTGQNILEYTTPKNIVISVGANNINSYPSTYTLLRINEFSSNSRVFRTDVNGNILVTLTDDGYVVK